MSSNLVSLADEKELIDLLAQNVPVIIHFHASWAELSLRSKDVISALSRKNSSLKFVTIDADTFPDIVEAYNVEFVPSTLFVVGKSLVNSSTASSPAEINSFVSASMSNQLPSQKSNPSGSINSTTISNSSSEYKVSSASISSETKISLNQRLEKLVNEKPVMVFIKGTPNVPRCGFSKKLINILKSNHISFGSFDILTDEDVRQGLKEFSNWPTFPQLYISGELIGGIDIVQEMIDNDEFIEAIPASSISP
ncbi:Monothiol glutaredoxin-S17 [Smittium culicis]|uniref:Monothiol glutaredoxin-S17 n=1 Tax=Smittium culicis TaxID=133412 RepID=A0A1R1X614_9FUNG|nr:Monothiol glutaredoxin-S17 [Smittium culicis]